MFYYFNFLGTCTGKKDYFVEEYIAQSDAKKVEFRWIEIP